MESMAIDRYIANLNKHLEDTLQIIVYLQLKEVSEELIDTISGHSSDIRLTIEELESYQGGV